MRHVLATTAVLVAALTVAAAVSAGRARVTNRCPTGALPLRASDLRALRGAALAAAPHGVARTAGRTIDYRGARATASFPSFYSGYVRTACPRDAAARVLARTADVHVGYPRVTWSASLSSSTFLVARTAKGFVVWAQVH